MGRSAWRPVVDITRQCATARPPRAKAAGRWGPPCRGTAARRPGTRPLHAMLHSSRRAAAADPHRGQDVCGGSTAARDGDLHRIAGGDWHPATARRYFARRRCGKWRLDRPYDGGDAFAVQSLRASASAAPSALAEPRRDLGEALVPRPSLEGPTPEPSGPAAPDTARVRSDRPRRARRRRCRQEASSSGQASGELSYREIGSVSKRHGSSVPMCGNRPLARLDSRGRATTAQGRRSLAVRRHGRSDGRGVYRTGGGGPRRLNHSRPRGPCPRAPAAVAAPLARRPPDPRAIDDLNGAIPIFPACFSVARRASRPSALLLGCPPCCKAVRLGSPPHGRRSMAGGAPALLEPRRQDHRVADDPAFFSPRI